MRKQLAKIDGQRMRFRAEVGELGTRTTCYGRYTVVQRLFKNVRRLDTNEIVTGHLWFADGLCWAGVTDGDIVEFDARVSEYLKGYKKKVLDWKLSRPTKISVIGTSLHSPTPFERIVGTQCLIPFFLRETSNNTPLECKNQPRLTSERDS